MFTSLTVTNSAGFTTTLKKQFVVYIPALIEVTPNLIKGNKGYSLYECNCRQSILMKLSNLILQKGVKALKCKSGYYNQAKNGQYKFERADFEWLNSTETLVFRGYVNGYLIVDQTTVKVQK